MIEAPSAQAIPPYDPECYLCPGNTRALAELSGLSLPAVELAGISQAAENNLVGCACGIMDPLTCVAGVAGHVLGIDWQDLSMMSIAVPDNLSIVIVNSNVQRGLVDSGYNLRRQQCELSLQQLLDAQAMMRDLFEISTPVIELLVELISAAIGPCGGVRMTGGGFGGCVVALVDESRVDAVVDAVASRYRAATGLQESIYITRPAPGASLLAER